MVEKLATLRFQLHDLRKHLAIFRIVQGHTALA